MSEPQTPDEMLAAAVAGTAYRRSDEEEQELIYEPEEIACTLTLDMKQAWILLVLLYPYRTAEAGSWEFVRAAWDVRRRIAEATGET